MDYAKKVAAKLFADLPVVEYYFDEDEGIDKEIADPLRDRQLKHALACESTASLNNMIKQARNNPGVMIEHEQLDVNPELLNVRNCTINLRTGDRQKHNPADLMTMRSSVTYDPDAKMEESLWESCLERWQPDPEIRHYLQVRAGACATGRATETFDVDYGTGANGKSKFHGAIQNVLGPYSVVPNKSLLVAEKHEQHATVVATLFRARMAIASETESRCTLNESMIKNVTGGDRLGCRRMREDEWSFDPTHTMILFTNYKPVVKGNDQGIWRRVRLVPWSVTIPLAEQDPELDQKLKGEASIILNWIIEGARIFLNEGMKVPESVRAATEEYRADEDFVGRFVRESLSFDDPADRTATVDITNLAEEWMEGQGLKWKLNVKDITAQMEAAGARNVGRVLNGGKRLTMWQGVGIRHSPD